MPLPDLPVARQLEALAGALETSRRAVLVAPPGAGKTTLVPLDLLRRAFLGSGRIILVEPRRLAARAAARRMADLLGEAVGETVGWRMRLDTKVTKRTRIEVVTEGVFSRMVLADPELFGIAAVIFDEFHERSLDGDFGLALALDVASALREDLALLVMSATLDGARVAGMMGREGVDAAVIESAGRAFPVEIRHRERPGTITVEEAVVGAVRDALAGEAGSLLAFLPGQREIERVAERLLPVAGPNVAITPLYGALDGAAQDRAVRPAAPGTRKVVLATSIAETSLTIEGVRVIIDSGLKRAPVFEPATGLSRLETVRVSRASADQRAGRAGRTEPGVAIRLWRAEQTAALQAFDRPEILSTDLSGLLLDTAAWGVADPRELAFLDPPPEAGLNEARTLLADLGALDADGRLTPIGETMRALPLPPRLARMVVAAPAGAPERAARLAVLLTERGLGGTAVDLDERLRRLGEDRGPRAKAAKRLADRISAGVEGAGESGEAETGELLALAFPDRVAIARGGPGRFVLSGGRGGALDPTERLAGEGALVVAELQGSAREGRILSAAALSRSALERLVTETGTREEEVSFDRQARAVRARRVTRLGRAVVASEPAPVPADERAGKALADGIHMLGLAALPFGKENERLLRRLRFLARAAPQDWPDLSEAGLLERLEDWLMPYLPGVTALADITQSRLHDALMGLVPPMASGRLDVLAPPAFEAPSGSKVAIRYDEDEPVLAIRVQELFGLTEHPAIAGGRLPLTLELLSPAGRPIQVTRDLPGFWAGSWAEVRAEMRGRYPKHPWPEDPAGAEATSRVKPRKG